jgi:diaminohydroxyphosphoribosylaminopyrimidine deaminase/5-amino-6-(5-phosphoribosylamino)uracil reductase
MKQTRNTSADSHYIRRTLRLAKKGLGKTHPNPMVGAVIVKGDTIIGEGYHRRSGEAHAEIAALHSVKGSSQGATLYVNLEPCAHHGKTPPCADAIIDAGIARVVVSTLDPNPLVKGGGVARLRRAGIDVSVGLLAEEARKLNEAFFGFHEIQRPFIAIKFAASLDGKIATASHESKWITNEKARRYARDLRSQYQAVLVGVNTVLYDDPHLGARLVGRRDPLRIILDTALRIPLTSQVLRDTNVLIITTKNAPEAKRKALLNKGIPLCILPGERIDLVQVRKELVRREIISILVEGGGSVIGSFVDNHLVDKVYAFYGPIIIGGTSSIDAVGAHGAANMSEALHIKNLSLKKFDDTVMLSGYTHTPSKQI